MLFRTGFIPPHMDVQRCYGIIIFFETIQEIVEFILEKMPDVLICHRNIHSQPVSVKMQVHCHQIEAFASEGQLHGADFFLAHGYIQDFHHILFYRAEEPFSLVAKRELLYYI